MSHFLFVSHVVPYPPTAGNEVRVGRLIEWLKSGGHQVSYLLNASYLDPARRAELEAHVDRLWLIDHIYMVPRPTFSLGPLTEEEAPGSGDYFPRLTGDIFTPAPLLAATYALCRQLCPDVVIAEYAFAAPCLSLVPRATLKLIDTHDVFSQRGERVRRFGIEDPYCLSPDEERRFLLECDAVLAIQPMEAQLLARLVPEREVLTIGVDFPTLREIDVSREASARLLIVGSGNALNLLGLRDFCTHAWPQIRRARPDAVLRIAGHLGDYFESDDERIQKVGWQRNLDQEWREATIVLNPTVAGTGLRIKTVEALSRAKALVAIKSAAEGISFVGEPPFAACEDWSDFAERTIELLEDPTRRRTLQERALAYSAEELTPERVYRPLADLLSRRLA